MATLLSFFPGVQTDVPYAPVSAIKNAVRDAAIQFCEETLIWKEELAAIDVVADQSEYDLTAPDTDSDIIAPVEVYYDEVRIDPLTEDWITQADASWKSKESETSSNYFVQYPDVLVLYPIPTVAVTDGLVIRAALRPAADTDEVPDFLFNRYRRAIEYGAKAILMGQKTRDWHDREGADKNEKLFRQALGAARGDVSRNFTTAPLRVRMRNW